MDGVLGMNPQHVKGDILINLDSEDEGTVLVSCDSGVNSIVKLPVEKSEISYTKEAYAVTDRGLMGGHSGIEINKNRASVLNSWEDSSQKHRQI